MLYAVGAVPFIAGRPALAGRGLKSDGDISRQALLRRPALAGRGLKSQSQRCISFPFRRPALAGRGLKSTIADTSPP